jgi:two-component system, NarL family, nitrate/nitrite response regulator NarL
VRTRLVIADDHPIVLDGLAQLFAGEQDFDVVARCSTGDEALAALRRHRPDVAVLDIRMPGMSGLDVLRHAREERLPTKVILLTAEISDESVVGAVRLGVAGIVLKETAPRVLVQSVRSVAAGEKWLDDGAMRRALDSVMRREAVMAEAVRVLTPRELEIVRMVATGLRNKQIAERLTITEGTVKIHLHSIYQKVNVSGRVELSIYAREKSLL